MSQWTGQHFAGRRLRERGGREYVYTATGIRITESSGATTEVPVRWAFGSGVQAVTPVIEADSKVVEHRLSWYRSVDKLALTPGHDPRPAADASEALGIAQTERNAERCYGCHMTLGKEPGVHCQSCHGEASEHARSPGAANVRRDTSVAMCATCHRSPDMAFGSVAPELDDERGIRFAPVGLLASRCYQESRGRLTCITCHDPHGERRATTIDGVCANCHKTAVSKTSTCPRVPNCAGCHMPSGSPIPMLRFTDHRIRVPH